MYQSQMMNHTRSGRSEWDYLDKHLLAVPLGRAKEKARYMRDSQETLREFLDSRT